LCNKVVAAGGALGNAHTSDITVLRSTFTNNVAATYGGAIFHSFQAQMKLDSCIFSGNSVTDYGGAVVTADTSQSTINNSTFCGNRADYTGNCISQHGYSVLTMAGNIFWDNRPHERETIYLRDNSRLSIEYSDIEGGLSSIQNDSSESLNYGPNNIELNPVLIEPGFWDTNDTPDMNDDTWNEGDYHLQWTSPCINLGDPNYLYTHNDRDIDGETRLMCSRIDIGADEVGPKQADITRDGLINFNDFIHLADSWLSDSNSSNWQVLCDLHKDDMIDESDLSLLTDDWLWSRQANFGPNLCDFNYDGTVNFVDFSLLALTWPSQFGDAKWRSMYDLNNDGGIDHIELLMLVDNWLWQTDSCQ
jgi:hypothetical protein